MKRLRVPIDRHADDQITEVLRNIVLVVPYRRHDPNATSHSSSTSRTHRQSGLYPVVISYSEERNTKTATVTATPTPTPKPAPIATPMPMLATAAPTLAPSTTPTNTLNGKAATPQREIFPDTGLTRQYQSIRLVSFKPCRNATTRGAESTGVVLRRNPITGIAGCCARAASGNAITPPSMLINSRRFTRSPRRRGRAVCREFGPLAPWRS
jgi:hypothetical protein